MLVHVKKIGAYEYLYLVENTRDGGRHVQRVIKALGRRDEIEASGLLDALIASTARHSRRSIVLSSFYRGELAELRRLSTGPHLLFGRLWVETGCREVLKSPLADRQLDFDVEWAIGSRRYVVCRNEDKARKDAETRATLLTGLERKLAQGDKTLVANTGFRRFVKTIGDGHFTINHDKAEQEAKCDGIFVLRTSSNLSTQQVVLHYRNLLAVETAFKTAKALLATRPVFNKTVISSALSSPWFCAPNCCSAWPSAAIRRPWNGNASSTNSPT